MGERGPVGKRSSQRRRRNAPARPIVATAGAAEVPIPEAIEEWHPIAKDWYRSLAASGQARYYEPSDWALAVIVAESLSRDLAPQFVGMTDDGEIIRDELPIKGTSLAAYLKAFNVLLVAEGDRRRLQIELQRPGGDDDPGPDKVAVLDAFRERATAG